MRQPHAPVNQPKPPDDSNSAVRLIIDMADTTWRMFVPIVGLLLLGRYIDNIVGTKPLLMLVGALCGAGLAAVLVKSQLTRES